MGTQRVFTGISGIDELIEGGFPLDSMIVMIGHAGAGKSIFASQFLYTCAVKHGKRGVYACFAETRENLLRNMKEFGWDFEQLESEGKVSILGLSVSKESGVQTNINKVMDTMKSLKADVLVIDSISAMAMALEKNIDVRIMIHLLYTFIKNQHCLCILIVDKPRGSFYSLSSGEEITEFIADGIIDLEVYLDDAGILQRRMTILKMRGTNHSMIAHPYSIEKSGFTILHEKKDKKATPK